MAGNHVQQAMEKLGQQFGANLREPIPQPPTKARGFGTKPQEAKKFIKHSARFVKESFGDKHPVKVGDKFTKKWTMRNDGKNEWPADTTLINTNGDDMQAKDLHIGTVRPDEEIEFELPLVAPQQPGRYSTYFRMRTGENYRFGHKIWCDILVEMKEVFEPAKYDDEDLYEEVEEEPIKYPTLDTEPVAELGDKGGASDGEPVVKVIAPEPKISAFADLVVEDKVVEETATETASNLTNSVSHSFMTPKQVYFDKMNNFVIGEDVKKSLKELFEMGFTNFEVNSSMLAKYNNDVSHVSNLLCEQILSESCMEAIFNK